MAMNMQSTQRQVEGRVEINFFASGSDNAASIKSSSLNPALRADIHGNQLFQHELALNTVASFGGGGIPLNGSKRLVGSRSNTGWIGNQVCNDDGTFAVPQFIEVEFILPRRLPQLRLEGYSNNEFATELEIKIYKEAADNELLLLHNFRVANNREHNLVWNFEDNEALAANDVKMIRLDIRRWNIVKDAANPKAHNILPRLRFFGGQMVEGFDGRELSSIDILEEITGSLDRLSYGISANMSKTNFINRNNQFYDPDYFKFLKPNRSVRSRVICGKYYPFGKYYSSKWKLNDGSPFMSVDSYDILMSLQSVDINFGKRISDSGNGLPVTPYDNLTVESIIARIFDLLDNERRANGLFDRIEPKLLLSDKALKTQIPLVLIENKPAWDILQGITNLLCAYVFVDREGYIVIREDSWVKQLPPPANQFRHNLDLNQSYRKVKIAYNKIDKESVAINGLHEFTVDADYFVTSESRVPQHIVDIADNILDKYCQGVQFVETTWKGDPDLRLGDKFLAKGLHEKDARLYECLSNEFSLSSSGFRQATKGRAVSGLDIMSPAQRAELIMIDPDNAFSFSLPILSQTVVNSVKVEYCKLVPCTDSAIFEINYDECEFEVNEQGNKIRGNDGRFRFTCDVDLDDRVFDGITRILSKPCEEEPSNDVLFSKIVSAFSRKIKIELTSSISNFTRFYVMLN